MSARAPGSKQVCLQPLTLGGDILVLVRQHMLIRQKPRRAQLQLRPVTLRGGGSLCAAAWPIRAATQPLDAAPERVQRQAELAR